MSNLPIETLEEKNPLTDTDKVGEAVKKIKAQIVAETLAGVEQILERRENTWRKKLQNIFKWIASQL